MSVASGNSFTLNSVDYGDSSHNLFVATPMQWLEPRWIMNTRRLAQADGEVSQGTFIGPRRWVLQCTIINDTPASLESNLAQVITDLNAVHAAGEQALVFDLFPTRQWDARPEGQLEHDVVAFNGYQFELTLYAPDPAETSP